MIRFSRHVSSRLAAYADHEVGEAEARRIEEHLAHCQFCRRERELTQSGKALLEYLPLIEAPDSLWLAIETGLAKSRPHKRQFGWRLALAALALLLIAAGAVFWSYSHRATSWELTQIEGKAPAGAKPVPTVTKVRIGEWIETDSSTRAEMKIGKIGSVEIAPDTRLRVVAARPAQDRLALNHGLIHAKISAPPKLFLVDTASGTAVDLGCEYSLHTDEKGSGLLQVTQGWVSFEWKGLESLVPAGASCRTRPQQGPGVPYFDDASAGFKQALADFASDGFHGVALDRILAEARVRDTLTLWHLLWRVGMPDRERIYNRIAALSPVPADVSRDKALKLDPETLTRWKDELAWTW